MRLSNRVVAVMVTSFALAGVARAATWNEATQGDISGNRQSPSLLTLTPGTNSILATTGSGDLEYLRLAVPGGGRINELRLTSFSGFDPTAPGGAGLDRLVDCGGVGRLAVASRTVVADVPDGSGGGRGDRRRVDQ